MLSTINSDFSQKSSDHWLCCMYDKLRFQPEIIGNAVCENLFCKNVYILNPIFLCVMRHVGEYDKLRFLLEIICIVVCVCEVFFAKMYIFLPLLFENGVNRHVEKDYLRFNQKSFVMLYV